MQTYRRFAIPPGQTGHLPLFVETIGTVREEGKIARATGYPYYHWLQTLSGEGIFVVDGRKYSLPAGSGILVPPETAHMYEPAAEAWETAYLTFGGTAAAAMLIALGLIEPVPVRWEKESPLEGYLERMLDRIEADDDPFGLEASADAYRFLLTMRRHGRSGRQDSVERASERLRPLIEWMDLRYADPDAGLADMRAVLGMPPSTMNELFRRAFGQSPYEYFIDLRIRKAKEMLIGRPQEKVARVATLAGFRDTSHFVATFRRKTGLPPDKFRQLYK
ncbi:AraC family transcriptional regulator [Cohnella rhizosphaerae]|uniref:AraC family transcriptional regulator n=1 Tax=Cohnella rhizosphaerae TaxID=1457232 RepID=A0A9X4L4E3_9BACL|nr:AraC family transcriptional regulator [Cohnella rhizosphaerae]MDG0813247.1 AraC family transcriptional regulator [Cohnella rhizosphaerae]